MEGRKTIRIRCPDLTGGRETPFGCLHETAITISPDGSPHPSAGQNLCPGGLRLCGHCQTELSVPVSFVVIEQNEAERV